MAAAHSSASAADYVQYAQWLDTDGNPVNAHGGGMLYHDGKYYWYGEYKTGKTILPDWATWECYRTDVTGVSCYSSPDLKNWTFEGLALKAEPDNPESDLHPSKVIERPKVVYNPKTKKFVMWVHAESADYSKAAAGVAVSDTPTGPFTYIGSFRPNGAMSRDQTVYVDDDGRAYHIFSSENNQTLHIAELTDDYLLPTGRETRNFIGKSREAPAVFKRGGKYYMISSGCTGWDPNRAELAVADSIMGQWTVIGDPCTGPEADKTFYAQSTYVLPVAGKKDAFIAMFDRWNKTDLADSRYVWLPVQFEGDAVTIPWRESWDVDDVFADEVKADVTGRLVEVAPGWSGTSVNTAVFRTNSVVTHGDTQYISFYDPEGYVTLGKRKLGTNDWQTERTQYKGNVKDGHNVISMGVDGNGYLHVSFDHHGHPLRYSKSVKPGSLKLGKLQPMTGIDEEKVTYPEFYSLPGGDLLFVYRSGASGRGNMAINRYDVKKKKWLRVQDSLIDGEEQRSPYWQMYVDANGVIHVSWVWRETWLVETNHDMCYARSEDGGKTWLKSDGTQYTLPITAANAEYALRIPQNSELINQTSMTADADSRPYIVSYWREEGSKVPQYRLIWHDGSAWRTQQISRRKTPFSLSGGGTKMIPISRPRIVADGGRTAVVYRDKERGGFVTIATTDDVNSGKWAFADLTDFDTDAWEPSIDPELWKERRQLHIFVQRASQGDGEKVVASDPTSVSVLETSL